MTQVLPATEAAIAQAAALIRAGEPVAVPTETVYGLAADATNPAAVAGIYAAKGRPEFDPLIVHVSNLAAAEVLGVFRSRARALAEQYWPGPLTLVVPLRADAAVASAVTAGLGTIALRCPVHPVMQELLAACGRPLAAPSANSSGTISPTRAEHVLRTLAGRIPLILDAGPTGIGLESTIVAVDEDRVRTLRAGPIQIEEAGPTHPGSARIEAPGQLASHYAPSKPVRLNASEAEAGEWLIGFGRVGGDDTLSSAGDLEEAGTRLYAALHRADREGPPRIAVAPVPDVGPGVAINDRLRRASAPRT